MPEMASNIPASDTSLWLHNKLGVILNFNLAVIIFYISTPFSLGTSNDSWTGGSIVSQLNPDILKKIRTCFQVSFGKKGK